jgi:hypothetical protein
VFHVDRITFSEISVAYDMSSHGFVLWGQKQVAFRLHATHVCLQVGACMMSMALQTVVLRRCDATFAEKQSFY